MGTAGSPRWRATAVAAAAATCLGGCVTDVPGQLRGAQTCVSWVGYETPADALADAPLVVTARVLDRDGTAPLFGVDAHAYTVSTAGLPVLAGDGVVPDRLRVISTPPTCTGDEDYPDGDPLATAGTVVLFLTRDGAGDDWRTMTPFHGVVLTTANGELSAAWPAR